jgi:hypothetical protein
MQLLDADYMRSSGNGPTWSVEIDPARRPIKSYYEETCIAAEMIWAQKSGPLQLCYSGGLDSEYVLAVLTKLGMKVEVVIMRNDYNYHETQYAFKYCTDHNIVPTIVDLDFDHFVDSGNMIEIAQSMKCAAYQIPASMWLAKQLDGTVLTGNDPPHMKLHHEGWYLDEEEIIHSQFNWWRQNNIQGTPFFLSYTPELMLSFLLDPAMQDLANNRYPGKLGTNSTKVQVFNRDSGFNLTQRVKQTGYEKIEQSLIFQHPDIQTIISWKDKWKGTSDHPYHEVVHKLSNGQTSMAFASKNVSKELTY